VELAHGQAQQVAPASHRFKSRGVPDGCAGRRRRPQRIAEREGIIRLDRRDAGAIEAETDEDRVRKRDCLVEPVWRMARLGAQQNPHCRRPIGKGRGNAFEPDLGHLVDGERQYVRR